MYEANLAPLGAGDFATVFAELLGAIEQLEPANPPARIVPENVVQWARPEVAPYLARICRRLLLPDSGVAGADSLVKLSGLARRGGSCIVCLNHRSNLDVPTLYALLEDQARLDLFRRLIWIAGRKLDEDVGLTPALARAFNRVVVSPESWLHEDHSDDELHEARQVNIAAHRAIHTLKHQGWVFALFPAATRARPNVKSTTQAIEETDSYLKNFEYLLLGRIDGCTLPVSRDRDLTHETPRLDRVRFTFGPVRRSADWRSGAASRYPSLDQRAATARAIIEDIAGLPSQ